MRFVSVFLLMAAIGSLLLSIMTPVGALNISDDERHELSRDLTRWQKKFGHDDHVRAALKMVRGTLTTDDLLRRLKAAKDKLPALQVANPHATFSHLTKFALLTDNEFARLVAAPTARPLPTTPASSHQSNRSTFSSSVIDSVDWTKQSICVPAVMSAGKCRSDWAIAAVAAVSSAHCLATGDVLALSVQQVLSCAYVGSLDICSGNGFTNEAMQWLILQSSALCTKAAIPYTSGATGTAPFCSDNAKCAGSISLQAGAVEIASGEASLALQLRTQPVTAYVSVKNDSWRLYVGGILSWCPIGGTPQYQAVLVIGYGAEDFGYGTKPVNYFKVRNNWGTQWGERGDVRLERGLDSQRGTCDVALYVTYPRLKSSQAAMDSQPT